MNSPEQNFRYIKSVALSQSALISSGDVFSAIGSSKSFTKNVQLRIDEFAHQTFGVRTITTTSVSDFLMCIKPIRVVTKNGTISFEVKSGEFIAKIDTKHTLIEESFLRLVANG